MLSLPLKHGTLVHLLVYGDGNSIIIPHTEDGYLRSLEPVPASAVMLMQNPTRFDDYTVSVNGKAYKPDEVLHFRYIPDRYHPWKGRGLRVSLADVANNLKQGRATEKAFMESEWKPSIIVKVDALTEEFASPEGRKNLLNSYIASGRAGEPWMIPADQFDIEQIKPLSLQDLAIADTMALNKKTVASIVGVPAFLLGVGSYNKNEWNNFVNTRVRSIIVSMRNPDKTAEVPKYKRLLEWAYVVMTFYGMVGVIGSRTVFGTASTAAQLIMCIVLCVILCIGIVLQVWAMLLMRIERKRQRLEVLENQDLCYICDSDAAIYFTGTSEQCLQEQAEMFTFLPQTMILTEEKYVEMFCCDIITE